MRQVYKSGCHVWKRTILLLWTYQTVDFNSHWRCFFGSSVRNVHILKCIIQFCIYYGINGKRDKQAEWKRASTTEGINIPKFHTQQQEKERKNIARNLYVYGWTVYWNDCSISITERSFVSYTFTSPVPIFWGGLATAKIFRTHYNYVHIYT